MEDHIEVFKALSDPHRVQIINMLSCGELCACDMIEGLKLTQPTVSHHMKILIAAELVIGQKDGKRTKYRLNREQIEQAITYLRFVSSFKENCICNPVRKTTEA